MRRRQLLALSGSLLASAAGCLSASAPEAAPAAESEPTQSATADAAETSTAQTTPADEYAQVSVALDALQPAMVRMTSPDSIGARRREDHQYLLVDASTRGDGQVPAPEAFSFEFDGTAHRPESVDDPWRIWRFYGDEEAFYDRDSGEGLLLFELPEAADSAGESEESGSGSSDGSPSDSSDDSESDADGSGPVLAWPGGEWRPDEAIRRRLRSPDPALSVSVDVPAEIELHESPTVSVTVENDGDVPGRFVAGLNRIGPRIAYAPVERVSLPVPAGGTETWEYDSAVTPGDYPDERVGDEQADVTFHLDWADGDVRRGVRYVD